ncbi:MAG: hypothetical protein [Circular genetic element sp.]|nr:MAG: hypothetical protein [Circular genetic element sp.]
MNRSFLVVQDDREQRRWDLHLDRRPGDSSCSCSNSLFEHSSNALCCDNKRRGQCHPYTCIAFAPSAHSTCGRQQHRDDACLLRQEANDRVGQSMLLEMHQEPSG